MENNKEELPKTNLRQIEIEQFSMDEAPKRLIKHIQNLLEVIEESAKLVYEEQLEKHLDQFKDCLSIVVEAPYVDKVYRDSYYNYFSSKHGIYPKDCVKLSFFDEKNYCGFMVLRPTSKNIVGRSVISPKALKDCNFKICSANFEATAKSIKYNVEGFPHSSQDEETITCAETSLWAIMEYFGNKYPEYLPVLPSKIVEVLRGTSYERQVPSGGLYFDQISYALREFGFGTRIYTRKHYKDQDFKKLFSCYIESGIPLIVEINTFNSKGEEDASIAHAILCIGHGEVVPVMIDNLLISGKDFKDDEGNVVNFKYYDGDDVDKEFVFIDDNRAVYQKSSFNEPNPKKKEYKISKFIVPLHPKVYLEAFQAKKFCIGILNEKFNIPDGSEIYLRFFLASSRSLKHKLSSTNAHNDELNSFILEMQMPKFVWVGELSCKELIKNGKANGIIIIDATEADTSNSKPLIMAAYLNKLFMPPIQKKPVEISIKEFNIFANNLK